MEMNENMAIEVGEWRWNGEKFINVETKTEFDKEGYDKNGYDKGGFNRAGWNKDGINQETNIQFDKEGYDKHGYDKDGFNRAGWNRDGYYRNDIYIDKLAVKEQEQGNLKNKLESVKEEMKKFDLDLNKNNGKNQFSK